MAKLNTVWTRHIRDVAEKEAFEKSVFNSQVALGRLRDILEEDLENLSTPTETDYDSASWAYRQAHRNGKAETIRKLLTLLEPIKK